jgi:hypothetical protein
MALATCTFAVHTVCLAVDGVSFEAGAGKKVDMARAGLQWDWNKQWFKSNGSFIGGYWDVTAGQWRETRFQNMPGASRHISAIGITPVFRYQSTDKKGFYAEAGIGAHLFSHLYDNDGKQESTAFLFGDHLGIGYVFSNRLDLGLKLQHFSNAGIKEPNDGVNFVVLKLGYRF